MIYFIPGPIFVIEIVLITLLLLLVAAAIYVLFIQSVRNDRREQALKTLAKNHSAEYGWSQDYPGQTLWDKVGGKTTNETQNETTTTKNVKIGIAFLVAAVVVLIILITFITLTK